MRFVFEVYVGPYRIPVFIGGTEDEHYGHYADEEPAICISDKITSSIRLQDTLVHEVVEAVVAQHDLAGDVPHHAIQTIGVGVAQALGPYLKLPPQFYHRGYGALLVPGLDDEPEHEE